MFERYSDSARFAVVKAQEAARRLNHNYIGTEHLLAAFAAHPGRSGATLTPFNITADYVTEKTTEIIGKGLTHPGGHIPFTPAAKMVLMIAVQEATELGDEAIDDTHLLLGLLGMEIGVGLQIINSRVANISEIREVLLKDMAITRAEAVRASGAIEMGVKLHALLEDFVTAGGDIGALDFTKGQADAARQIIEMLKCDGGSADFTLSA